MLLPSFSTQIPYTDSGGRRVLQ